MDRLLFNANGTAHPGEDTVPFKNQRGGAK